jgi:hypothetical protein
LAYMTLLFQSSPTESFGHGALGYKH